MSYEEGLRAVLKQVKILEESCEVSDEEGPEEWFRFQFLSQASPGAKALAIGKDISRFMVVEGGEALTEDWSFHRPETPTEEKLCF